MTPADPATGALDADDARGPPRLPGGLVPTGLSSLDHVRGLALLATLALVGAFTAVMYHVADIAGTPDAFLAVVVGTLLGATMLAGVLSESRALALGAGLLVVGLVWYLLSLSYVPRLLPIVESNLALLTGQSINQIRQSGVWVLGVAPTPVFVTWYLALRRYYGSAALVGGIMLGYFVLTNDAAWPTTLLGMVGIGGMFGFGDLDRRGTSLTAAEHVAIALAVMVIAPLIVSVAPAGAASPLSVGGDGGGTTTVETALLADNAEITAGGAVDLSPDVRFTVESPVERYWKATAYDRYTGEGWVRTGGTVPLEQARLSFPSGPRRTVRQSVEVQSPLATLPAAWRPIAVDGDVAERVRVTDAGDLLASTALEAGETYGVTSAVATDVDEHLRTAGTDYPRRIQERYTSLPRSTPDRVERRTAEITEGAETPHETAAAIERWLEDNREYSLDVDRPDGDITDAFLFEMEEGYCTYFATAMVVMLRSEDVPARLATGYTSGQQVDEGRWVVRGLNAHAWVEVYVEDLGWVAYDPTPAGPRQDTRSDRIAEARENNETGVDTDETRRDSPSEETDDATADDPVSGEAAGNESAVPGETLSNLSVPQPDPVSQAPTEESPWPDLPPREHVLLGLVVLGGVAAGVRRSGAWRWLVRTTTVVWQPRADPATDVERAYRRVSILMARRHRPRRPGETVRQYMAAIDAPAAARRVAEIRERVRYAEDADEELADEAVALADELRNSGVGGKRQAGPARGPDW